MTPLIAHNPDGAGDAVRYPTEPREVRICATPGCGTRLRRGHGPYCSTCEQQQASGSPAPLPCDVSAPATRIDKGGSVKTRGKAGERKAAVLQCVTRMGSTTARAISEELGISRPIVAEHLRELESRGELTMTRQGTTHFYAPAKEPAHNPDGHEPVKDQTPAQGTASPDKNPDQQRDAARAIDHGRALPPESAVDGSGPEEAPDTGSAPAADRQAQSDSADRGPGDAEAERPAWDNVHVRGLTPAMAITMAAAMDRRLARMLEEEARDEADVETRAITACIEALAPLDGEQAQDVLEYLARRFVTRSRPQPAEADSNAG